MKMKSVRKNGFTLVELLAIIVIIAIIAIVTVPIVLRVINTSKEGSIIDSAYGYKDAISKFYYSKVVDDLDDRISNGVHTVAELSSIGVEVNGNYPNDGWVDLDRGFAVAYSLRFGDYVVTKYSDSDISISKDGTIMESPLTLDDDNTADLIQAVTDAADLYVKAALQQYSSTQKEFAKYVKVMALEGLEQPEDLGNMGWIHFNYSSNTLNVVSYSLKFGDYVANYSSYQNGNYVSFITEGDELPKPMFYSGTLKSDGATYLINNAPVVFFDPTAGDDGEICIEGSTGCYRWHVYSVKGEYANMLMDHNFSATSSASAIWASSSDYSAGLTAKSGGGFLAGEGANSVATQVGISYPSSVTSFTAFGSANTSRGPLTALKHLISLTSTWKTGTPQIPNQTSTDEHIVPFSDSYNKYQIDYTGYHARILARSEASNLGCNSTTMNSCPSWMIENIYNNHAPYGYWVSSPYTTDGRANVIDAYQNLNYMGSYRTTDTDGGVRPVITVSAREVLNYK